MSRETAAAEVSLGELGMRDLGYRGPLFQETEMAVAAPFSTAVSLDSISAPREARRRSTLGITDCLRAGDELRRRQSQRPSESVSV